MNVGAVFVWPGERQYRVKGYSGIYVFAKASVKGIPACIAGKRPDYGDARNDGGFNACSDIEIAAFEICS
jgi:hypothetical protein